MEKEKKKYRLSPFKIGAPLTIQSANQIQDMGTRLNEGIKNIEISAISPEIAGNIPEEHFREMKRLGELTDSRVSVHAPIVDASGFRERMWSETQRKESEQEFDSIVTRAGILGKNTPVVIHGANFAGRDWDRETEQNYKKDYADKQKKYLENINYENLSNEDKKEFSKQKFLDWKRKEIGKLEEPMPRVIIAVNQDTGQIQPFEYEKRKQFLGDKVWDPYTRLRSVNQSEWDKNKLDVMAYQKQIYELEEQKRRVEESIKPYQELIEKKKDYILTPEEKQRYELSKQKANMIEQHIDQINQHVNSVAEDIHDKLVRFKNKDHKVEKFLEGDRYNNAREHLKILEKQQENLSEKSRIKRLSKEEEQMFREIGKRKIDIMSNIMAEMPAPEIWKPVSEFSIEKASETFSNVALNAYEKYGQGAPIIAIENSYPNMPLSKGKELKRAIDKTRELFVEKLTKKNPKIGKDEASKIASQIIGATWDVGHINLLRKVGYSEEEIVKESKEIAKHVKHVHLTDNFGLNDTHLPPGLGNVPIKKILETLEKEGDMENVRHIIEAGNFVKDFKQSPYPQSLENLGSPLYKFEDSGKDMYWTNLYERNLAPEGEYHMGYGDILPELHFKKLYGAGFSGLPKELGGGGETPERGRFASGE